MKILLAEDTYDLNRAVKAILDREGYDTDQAFDGEDALDKIKNNGYDLIILDIMMPKADGIEVLKSTRESGIITPVLLLTAKAEIDDKVNGLDAGADDYLTKPFAMKELLARIRAMTRRKTQYNGGDLQYLDIRLRETNLELSCENAVRLSIKEYELLKTFITNSEHAIDTEFILEHVWNDEPEAGGEVVWLYVSYLNRKLRAVASKAYIDGSLEAGYRLVGQE